MKIPLDALEDETLNSIVEAFVLREGTDYGAVEVSLSDKIVQVKNQLKLGTVILVYSELYETVDIVPADKFNEV